jgi:hypothetical protein
MENAGRRSMIGADKIEENSVKKYLERQHYLLLEDFCRPLRTAIGIAKRNISPTVIFCAFSILFNLNERDLLSQNKFCTKFLTIEIYAISVLKGLSNKGFIL